MLDVFAGRPSENTLRSQLVRLNQTDFAGCVLDTSDPNRRFAVEILLDGWPFAVVNADQGEPDASDGDGAHGFRIRIPEAVLSHHTLVSARLANTHLVCGQPIDLSLPFGEANAGALFGGWVQVDGDGWIGGALSDCGAEPAAIFLAEGSTIHVARPEHPVSPSHPGTRGGTNFVFRAYLADQLAPDRLTRIRVCNDRGMELEGSPLYLAGSPDPIVGALVTSGRLAHRSDRLLYYRTRFPRMLPMGLYEEWKVAARPAAPPVAIDHAVVLVGSGDPHLSVADLGIGRGSTLLAIALPDASSPVSFDGQDLLQSLTDMDELPDRLVFAPAGTRFGDGSLARLLDSLDDRAVAFAYGDVEMAFDGRTVPFLMPAFDYERLLEQGYCAFVFAAWTEDVRRVAERLRPATLYDLIFGLLETAGASPGGISVGHVPFPIAALPDLAEGSLSQPHMSAVRAHLARRGQRARLVPGGPSGFPLPILRIARELPSDRGVTAIVPTRDRADLLERCIATLHGSSRHVDLETIIVDNGSQEAETARLFDAFARDGIRVIRDDKAFNYARINNQAVAEARSNTILFLNNDVEFLDEDTLAEMLSRLVEPDVGAVGILMRRQNDVIQHGGVVLGPSFAAVHSYTDRVFGDPGYCDGLRVAHQCSAVTAACMMVRKRDFLSVGGFDATGFPIAFNDVDLCLKFGKAGLRTVLTPHQHILHHESVSRGRDDTLTRRPLFARELAKLRETWSAVLLDDPYYNPCLGRGHHPYDGLATDPLHLAPRLRTLRLG